MPRKPLFWFLLSLLCVAAASYFWHPLASPQNNPVEAQVPAHSAVTGAPATSQSGVAASASPVASSLPATNAAAQNVSSRLDPKKLYPYRLSNTDEPYQKLVHNDRGILLMNALMDTGKPLNLSIPDRLRAPADNGSYIVQARGALDDQFRAALAQAGATIISYIPNNAYLVRVSESGAQQLSATAQSVLPYQPYYKLDTALLKMVIETPNALPSSGALNVTLFPDAGNAGLVALQKIGAQVVSQDDTPFGPVVKVFASPGTLAAVASLPGVQGVSVWTPKHVSNDLMRPTLGVSLDSTNLTNYIGLTGNGVFINVNDTGVDVQHPDLAGGISRITSDDGNLLTARDPNGHGTHVIGTILGTGAEAAKQQIFPEGSLTNANFRGMAPNANAYVMSYNDPDSYLQTTAVAALPNKIRISNNSWNYGNGSYDIFAASYDAAVRDANPFATGSQPVLYVFSAGNVGGGNSDGTGGNADSILSPATAKNVITVGALEQRRFIELIIPVITNVVTNINGHMTNLMVTNMVTNDTFLAETDHNDQVASFSSRGNVGLFTEGTAGRFKPDVVAPGTFVVSCRSGKWATNSYYNPTNVSFLSFPGISIITNSLFTIPPILIPPNAVEIQLYVSANIHSPSNLPTVPIYGVLDTFVTLGNFIGDNSVTIPTNSLPLNPDSSIYFGILNTNSLKTLNVDATVVIYTTNDVTDLLVLSNLNNQIAPYYRYESGTSMAAAGVSGMLACMQEYFESRLNITNSPAMMKALLINGARNAGQNYDFGTTGSVNSEGWGLPNLPNSTPGGFTNIDSHNAANLPMLLFDQNPTNALATGQSRTWTFTLSPDAQNQDLRFTLVWTDPPGNPNAGTKLVNDLDLIVTDDAGGLYYGNDIPIGSLYNELGDTNAPITDSVNNVENVYIQGPQPSGNYTVTVLGRRVNVNAVTANTNGIVQDFALVVSSGDAGGVTNPISLTGFSSLVADASAGTLPVTNLFIVTNGFPLFNQRVGANSQFTSNTTSPLVAYVTNGTLSQWNFYIYTNIPTVSSNDPNPANYTNVAIATIVPPNLGVPRMGAYNEVDPSSTNATRNAGADIDLYVSQDPGLTNLNPTAIANAWASNWVSATRSGTETILLTNSAPGQVYYIGVKSEDQQAAQYLLFAEATDQSFNNMDSNGNILVTMLPAPPPFPLLIPGGSAPNPQHALILGFTTSTASIRNVIVTNTVTFPDFGDLIGTLSLHADTGDKTVVLNNHTFFTNANDATETFVYDDTGQTPGARKSDGPGSTQNFTGAKANGTWMFTMVNDSSTADTGYIQNFQVVIQPQMQTNRFTETIPPMSWFYDYVDIPDFATNLTIFVTQTGGTLNQVELYIKEGSYPTITDYDVHQTIPSAGGSASISKFTSPPLNADRYFYGIYNPNSTPQTVNIYVEVDDSLTPVATYNTYSKGNEIIPDDAVMYSTNNSTMDGTVVSAEVGVRIIHPRESDLVLTLVSPQGTRVLLAENRGGLDTNGYGSGFNTTNAVSATSGGIAANTNTLNISTNFGTVSGTLIINYDFFTVPDDLQVYYAGQLIYDTGLTNGTNTISVQFGPGTSTNLSIVMNYPGTNPTGTNGDAWQYNATVITANATYATFTEDTNKTTLPIKFAMPPFGGGAAFLPPVPLFTDSFEGFPGGIFASDSFFTSLPGNTNSPNLVVTVPALAATEANALAGSNVLALHDGTITGTMPTKLGQNYTLTFQGHGRPSLGPIGWWKGEGDVTDYGSQMNQTGNFTPFPGTYTNGIVGKAFAFDPELPFNSGTGIRISDRPAYALTNSLTIEGWIRPRADSVIIFCREDINGTFPYLLYMLNNHTLAFDINNGSAEVTTTLAYNQWYHVAATLDGAAGTMSIYTNGALAAAISTTVRPIGPIGANPGLGIGNDGSGISQHGFIGDVDEIALYDRALTPVEIQDVYAAGSAGKSLIAGGSVTANLILGINTNQFTVSDGWSSNGIHFTAPSANMALTIFPATNTDGTFQDGLLLDSFSLSQDAVANPTNFYLPEEPLAKVVGEGAAGNWKLEVLDNRAGPATASPPTLVSWQLSLVLADATPFAASLTHHVPQTNTVQPNNIVYYKVAVPLWAQDATNILNVTSGTVNLLFNQTGEPKGNVPPDSILLNTTTTGGTVTLNTNTSSPLLVPGQTYYLGIQNLSSSALATFTIEVDFDIISLTNAIPVTNKIAVGNLPRYFQFDVDSNNEVAVEFQILNPSGNVALVASYGPPLPDFSNFAYLSDLPGATPQNIIVITNSTPVPLKPGRWYLGVFNNDVSTVTYTIVATETGPPTIIPLSDGVPVSFSALPGPPFFNFFSFTVTNNAPSALFELYNLSGNADLSLDVGRLPYSFPVDAESINPGTNEEQIVVLTTNASQNATLKLFATSVNGTFYLGVPNNTSIPVTYTIRASLPVNGILIPHEPITVSETVSAGGYPLTLMWTGVAGDCYQVQISTDLINWTNFVGPGYSGYISSSSPNYVFQDTAPVSSPPYRFYRIRAVKCP